MDRKKNFKRVEHRCKCRMCLDIAQLKRGRRYYCAPCYQDLFLTPGKVDTAPITMTTADVMAALSMGVVRGRDAADILERLEAQP